MKKFCLYFFNDILASFIHRRWESCYNERKQSVKHKLTCANFCYNVYRSHSAKVTESLQFAERQEQYEI